MTDMRVAIVGAGGVGGFFGAQLYAGGVDARFLARGSHYAAIKQNGLTVISGGAPIVVPGDRFFDTPSGVGTSDVILFCVKSYDTEQTALSLGPMLHDHSVVVSLQNGVENEEIIAHSLTKGSVFGGVAYIYATVTQPGTVTEWGGPKKIVFGPLREKEQMYAQGMKIFKMLVDGGVDTEYSANVGAALWSKFIFITAVGGITALTRLTLGEILAVPETARLLHAAMEESLAVARGAGAEIPPNFIEDAFARLAKYDNKSRSSLYIDLANERRLELDALSGAVVRFGTQYGVATPIHTLIYAALIPYHRAAVSRWTQGNS